MSNRSFLVRRARRIFKLLCRLPLLLHPNPDSRRQPYPKQIVFFWAAHFMSRPPTLNLTLSAPIILTLDWHKLFFKMSVNFRCRFLWLDWPEWSEVVAWRRCGSACWCWGKEWHVVLENWEGQERKKKPLNFYSGWLAVKWSYWNYAKVFFFMLLFPGRSPRNGMCYVGDLQKPVYNFNW